MTSNVLTPNVLSMHSGGLVSWATGKRCVEQYGADSVRLLFADTLIEDSDLYRFVVEGAANILQVRVAPWLVDLARSVPPVDYIGGLAERRRLLPSLARLVRRHIPGLHWIMDGRTPWEVFRDERFIGNSQVDPCSRILKRQLMDAWRDRHCQNWNTILAFGLDWSERGRIEGRRAAPGKKAKPGHRARMEAQGWRSIYPMDEPPYLTKNEIIGDLHREGIAPPYLYSLGFPHNNCGGFCCKMGLAQAEHLLETQPSYFNWSARQEKAVQTAIGASAGTCLRLRSGGRTRRISLDDFRSLKQQQGRLYANDGWGCGGGCAIDDGSDEDHENETGTVLLENVTL